MIQQNSIALQIKFIQGYRSTELQGYRTTELQGYRTKRLQNYKDTKLQSYRTTEIQNHRATELHSYRRLHRSTESYKEQDNNLIETITILQRILVQYNAKHIIA